MQRKDSILYRTTNENEDSITELLCNLMRDKYVRDILLLNLQIPREIFNDIKFDDISTQVNLRESGKPDICIQNKDFLIYIENKIYKHTNLQDNQITSYLDKLKKSNKKHRQMIYLIPKEYNHLNSVEYVCKQNDFCVIVYWDDFLNNISKYEIEESNQIFKECFRFFKDKLLSKSISIKFKPEEIIIMYNTKDFITAHNFFIKLRNVIINAEPLIIKELGNDFTPSDWSWDDNENEKGKYLNYKNEQKIFYGLNFNIVREKPENRDYLLAVAITLDILDINRIENFKKEKDNIIWDNEWCYVKMDKYNLTEDNNSEAFAKNFVEIVKQIL